jgi:hypothetical protein
MTLKINVDTQEYNPAIEPLSAAQFFYFLSSPRIGLSGSAPQLQLLASSFLVLVCALLLFKMQG